MTFWKVPTGSQQKITNGLRTDVPKDHFATDLYMKETASKKNWNLGFPDW